MAYLSEKTLPFSQLDDNLYIVPAGGRTTDLQASF